VTVAGIFNFENIIKVIMFIGSDDRYWENLYSDVELSWKVVLALFNAIYVIKVRHKFPF